MEMTEDLPKTTTASTEQTEYMTVKEISEALHVSKDAVQAVVNSLAMQPADVHRQVARKNRGVYAYKVFGYTEQQCWQIARELAKSHNKKDNDTVKSAVQNWTWDKIVEILNPWTEKVDTLLKEQQEQIAALQAQNTELTTRNKELTTNVVQLARDLSTVSLLTACKHKGQIRTQLNRVEYDTDALLHELRERLANG